jgi:DNA-binding NarL/FixJ family response regulator
MNKKVLYVSNEDPSQLLRGLRERFPADYDSANNRYEALEGLESKQYDVVIMTDLALAPGILIEGEAWASSLRDAWKNGMEVARSVKERGLPLFILTSAGDDYRRELTRTGVDGVFKKVVEYGKFLDALEEFFNR